MLRSSVSGLLQFAILLIIVKNAHPQRRQAEVKCIPGKTQFPNPNDRHSFYKCDAGGNPVLFQCPAGTWFNPRLEVCDWDNKSANYRPPTNNNNNNNRPNGNNNRPNGNNNRPNRPNPWDEEDNNVGPPSGNAANWWSQAPVPEVSPEFASSHGAGGNRRGNGGKRRRN